uniref:Uncharacterized protein n=1 Tax=viral metagenome TaxID=1070528 RepID=A0A6M3KBA2_9ZZZZ
MGKKKEKPKPINVMFLNGYDSKGRPVVTSCLALFSENSGEITDRFIYCRGTAICSSLDFCRLTKKRGRQIALGRAISAMEEKMTSRPLMSEREYLFTDVFNYRSFVTVVGSLYSDNEMAGPRMFMKSGFNVDPNSYEREMYLIPEKQTVIQVNSVNGMDWKVGEIV